MWLLTLLASSRELLSYVKIYLEGWNFHVLGKVLQLSQRQGGRENGTRRKHNRKGEKKEKLWRHNKNIHPFSQVFTESSAVSGKPFSHLPVRRGSKFLFSLLLLIYSSIVNILILTFLKLKKNFNFFKNFILYTLNVCSFTVC